MNDQEKAAALAEAFSGTVTPYSQIKENAGIGAEDTGQYDWVVGKLEPKVGDNGLYCIEGEFPVQAPAGFAFPYRRTLWIGTKKDPFAKLPETRLNSPGLRFLKNIAKVNNIPTHDQSDAALCAALRGRGFGCRIEANTYTGKDGKEKKGTDFGRNVTPIGMIPARLDKQTATLSAPAAAASTNGGAAFAEE